MPVPYSLMINDEIIFVLSYNSDNIIGTITYYTNHHYTTGRVEYNTRFVLFCLFPAQSPVSTPI